ncbi:MAG: hypothetical protein HYY93_05535 [Planctomycetes bacterium]|nr:hypothetical protein [Planctomycetota bacterium]
MPFSDGKAISRFALSATHRTWGDVRDSTIYFHKLGKFCFMVEVSRSRALPEGVDREVDFLLSHLRFTPVRD